MCVLYIERFWYKASDRAGVPSLKLGRHRIVWGRGNDRTRIYCLTKACPVRTSCVPMLLKRLILKTFSVLSSNLLAEAPWPGPPPLPIDHFTGDPATTSRRTLRPYLLKHIKTGCN